VVLALERLFATVGRDRGLTFIRSDRTLGRRGSDTIIDCVVPVPRERLRNREPEAPLPAVNKYSSQAALMGERPWKAPRSKGASASWSVFRQQMPPTRPAPPPVPPGLPVPLDDGGAAHLVGQDLPDIALPSTTGRELRLLDLPGALVLYLFPGMGPPHQEDPPGWSETPGVYGCTQQACGFRDRYREYLDLGYSVVGISAQAAPVQQEASRRLVLDFPLLADPRHQLGEALKLPTFEIAGGVFYKRLTMVVREQRIVKVFYPVFPPHKNATRVLRWIQTHTG
jgi:peroxiredoxin